MNQTQKSPPALLSLWRGCCVWYTSVSVVVLLLNLLFSGNEKAYVEPLSFLLFLPFAFSLALAGLVRRSDRLSAAARAVLHPICTLGGFYLCIYLPYQIEKKPSPGQMLAIFVLVAVVYGVTVAVMSLVSRRARQKKIDNAPYVSQFGQKP